MFRLFHFPKLDQGFRSVDGCTMLDVNISLFRFRHQVSFGYHYGQILQLLYKSVNSKPERPSTAKTPENKVLERKVGHKMSFGFGNICHYNCLSLAQQQL